MDRRITNNSIYFCYNNKNKVRSQGLWNNSSDDDDDDYHECGYGYGYVDHHHHDGGLMMLAWPPRSYTCSFCKREFRSAQALGGHMNVHRRDRAQLRQLSQISHNLSNPNTYHHINTTTNTINLNFPPNPNYHMLHSPPSPPTTPAFELGTPTSTLSSSSTAQPSPSLVIKPPTPSELITKKQFDCFKRHNNLEGASPNYKYDAEPKFDEGFGFKRKEQDTSLNKARGIIRLDFEMNIDVGDNVFKEELDLELRLGYN